MDSDLFQYGDAKGLSLGGGGAGAALHLDSNLLHGSTDRCATFANAPLTGKPGLFQAQVRACGGGAALMAAEH